MEADKYRKLWEYGFVRDRWGRMVYDREKADKIISCDNEYMKMIEALESRYRIIQMNGDGIMLRIWKNMREPADCYHIAPENICKCCRESNYPNSVRHTLGGYTWEYYDKKK